MARGSIVASLGLVGSLCACDVEPPQDAHAPPSPQATAEPVPLTAWDAGEGAPGRTLQLARIRPERAAPPDPLPPPRGVGADGAPARSSSEPASRSQEPALRSVTEAPAMRIDYVLRSLRGSIDARVPDAALDTLRARLQRTLRLEFSQGRARAQLLGVWLLPDQLELLARADTLGLFAVQRSSNSYRPLPPGSLRNFLVEGRFDVSPLLPTTVTLRAELQHLGVRARELEVSTPLGTLRLWLARSAEALEPAVGKGFDTGPMLCRLFADLLLASFEGEACGSDEVPLRASIQWNSNQSGVVFDAQTLPRRTEVPWLELLAPPRKATHQQQPWQPFASRLLFAAADLRQLKPSQRASAPANDEGLWLHNHRNQPYWVWLEGLPVAWVGPGSSVQLRGLQPGSYDARWATELDDVDVPRVVAKVPGLLELSPVTGSPR